MSKIVIFVLSITDSMNTRQRRYFSFRRYLYLCFLILSFSLTACRTARVQPASQHKTVSKETKKESSSSLLGIVLSGNENPMLIHTCGEWMGVPYKYGCCSKDGTDCSCLVQTIYKTVYNKDLFRSASDMYEKNISPISVEQAKEGDLVFFKIDSSKPSHVGILIKDRYFIHASTSKGVVVNSLDEPYYITHFIGAGKVR